MAIAFVFLNLSNSTKILHCDSRRSGRGQIPAGAGRNAGCVGSRCCKGRLGKRREDTQLEGQQRGVIHWQPSKVIERKLVAVLGSSAEHLHQQPILLHITARQEDVAKGRAARIPCLSSHTFTEQCQFPC